jgi:peptidoglycan hydrolase CwlO-like protein
MLAVTTAALAPTATADSNLQLLIKQRTALQAQVSKLGADQSGALQKLIDVQDRLANLRGQVARNQSDLATLESRRTSLEAGIAAARTHITAQQHALGLLVRQQYKSRAQTSADQVLFGSSNFSDAVNRIVAARAVSDREHLLLSELRTVESSLVSETADLTQREAEIGRLQGELAARKASLQTAAADYHAQINALSASSTDLLAQINSLNAQILALTRPPAGNYTQSQQQIIAIIRTAAARYNQDGDRLVRVAKCESGLNPRAQSSSGASGLFQFMPGTFYGNGGHDIWDPTDQSNIAAKMFSQGRSGDWSCQ